MKAPMNAEAFPLQWPEGWPRTKTLARRGWYQFRGLTPGKGYATLIEELKRLGATSIVVSSNAQPYKDGGLSAERIGRRLEDPGVAVYFYYNAKPMVMAQDAYDAPYINMRSLALAINAMRAIERHGGGYMMQRSFDGFAALPPPEGGTTAQPKRPWREVLGMEAFGPHLPPAAVLAGAEAAWKTLLRTAHPDHGGSHEATAELNLAIQEAREELRQ